MSKQYSNGDSYEGFNTDGMRDGHGVCTYANGKGPMTDGEPCAVSARADGSHCLTANLYPSSGARYEGMWSRDQRSGPGELHLPNGDVYVGEFMGDAFHGLGKYTWHGQHSPCEGSSAQAGEGPVEMEYEGAWVEGRRSGAGKGRYSDGSVYKGAWARDLPGGKGQATYTHAGVSVTVSGEWEAGVLRRGSEARGEENYSGEFQGRLRHGYGTVSFKDGSEYEGFWRFDRRNGQGEGSWTRGGMLDQSLIFLTVSQAGTSSPRPRRGTRASGWLTNEPARAAASTPRGTSLTVGRTMICGSRAVARVGGFMSSGRPGAGVWKDGLRTGYGVIKYNNGDIFMGTWENDKKHGPGVFQKKFGTPVKGVVSDEES
jgi:hypothetical protein